MQAGWPGGEYQMNAMFRNTKANHHRLQMPDWHVWWGFMTLPWRVSLLTLERSFNPHLLNNWAVWRITHGNGTPGTKYWIFLFIYSISILFYLFCFFMAEWHFSTNVHHVIKSIWIYFISQLSEVVRAALHLPAGGAFVQPKEVQVRL